MLAFMRAFALAITIAFTGSVAADASGTLSARTAERALTQRLARYQGFRTVHADCRRRTSREQRCTWNGRRAGHRWHGRAVVRRLKGGSVDVRITAAQQG